MIYAARWFLYLGFGYLVQILSVLSGQIAVPGFSHEICIQEAIWSIRMICIDIAEHDNIVIICVLSLQAFRMSFCTWVLYSIRFKIKNPYLDFRSFKMYGKNNFLWSWTTKVNEYGFIYTILFSYMVVHITVVLPNQLEMLKQHIAVSVPMSIGHNCYRWMITSVQDDIGVVGKLRLMAFQRHQYHRETR
jgi:hypothetical protein